MAAVPPAGVLPAAPSAGAVAAAQAAADAAGGEEGGEDAVLGMLPAAPLPPEVGAEVFGA